MTLAVHQLARLVRAKPRRKTMNDKARPQKDLIEVAFLHPNDSTKFRAKIGRETTCRQALDNLVNAQFIPKNTYALAQTRTNKTLTISESLVGQGVEDGDDLQVTAIDRGA
jgi:hypothetical protein